MKQKADKLERFVRQNKEDFDDLNVPAGLWEGIEKGLPSTPAKKLSGIVSFMWKAAAAVLIFASAWYLHDYYDHIKPRGIAKAAIIQPVPSQEMNELADAEAYYTSQINSRQAELVKYTKDHPEIMEDLKKEFRQLDNNNVELKKDLAESNANEKVVEAIIQSYRMKLAILEEMLTEMQKAREIKTPTSTNL
ncbi:MAG: hypothetical protein HXX13_04710 [Bacteroidetes bacterium]|nr:hypothetical protein [Bacteroidota bacterium]